ncbi:putative FAD/NAD(P)-binding domain-containing protein [Seiridium unicorne]|uniref:FAD/NAD(P)-binding domain-containing protein n=1 Tax=Seiridium unicorne TaxID=138068 RepID=A0ABR2UG70_9PEZI
MNLIQQPIKDSQNKIANSKHIVIGGAGVVGVEFARELGDLLQRRGLPVDCEEREVTLVCPGDRVLPMLPVQVGLHAEKLLKQKGVQLLKERRIDSVSRDHDSGVWSIVLTDGQIIHADFYISTAGLIPNTSFVPKTLLSSEGWITVDEKLRVVSNNTDDGYHQQVYRLFASGDVTTHEPRIVRPIAEQAAVVAANIKADIDGIALEDIKRLAYLNMIVRAGIHLA